MAIGTGASGTGDYASNYKTPNYTQYTQQDFKGDISSAFQPFSLLPSISTIEFMPNYQEMMNTTMGVMGGGASGSAGSGFTNFSSVNVMLKGFIELQKQQMEVEKAKAEASRAKTNLALQEYEEEDVDDQPDYVPEARRRSFPMGPMGMGKRRRRRSWMRGTSSGMPSVATFMKVNQQMASSGKTYSPMGLSKAQYSNMDMGQAPGAGSSPAGHPSPKSFPGNNSSCLRAKITYLATYLLPC